LPKEEVQPKEEIRPKEEAKPKEATLPKEEAQPKEEVQPKEEIRSKEDTLPKEEPKGGAKPKEEIRSKEETLPKEKVQPKARFLVVPRSAWIVADDAPYWSANNCVYRLEMSGDVTTLSLAGQLQSALHAQGETFLVTQENTASVLAKDDRVVKTSTASYFSLMGTLDDGAVIVCETCVEWRALSRWDASRQVLVPWLRERFAGRERKVERFKGGFHADARDDICKWSPRAPPGMVRSLLLCPGKEAQRKGERGRMAHVRNVTTGAKCTLLAPDVSMPFGFRPHPRVVVCTPRDPCAQTQQPWRLQTLVFDELYETVAAHGFPWKVLCILEAYLDCDWGLGTSTPLPASDEFPCRVWFGEYLWLQGISPEDRNTPMDVTQVHISTGQVLHVFPKVPPLRGILNRAGLDVWVMCLP
jgi:hypothetical protein